jgi:fucose permease
MKPLDSFAVDHLAAHMLPHSPKGFYRLSSNAFFFIMGMTFASWASRIPDIKLKLGLDDAAFGTTLLGAPVGQFLIIFAAGILVSRFGSRRMLAISLPVYASALVGLSLADSRPQLFFCLMLFGASGGMFSNSVNTQAVGVERLYRRSILASSHGVWSLGGLSGGVAGTFISAWDIQPLWHFTGMLCLDLLILVLLRPWTIPRDMPGMKRIVTRDDARARAGSGRNGRAAGTGSKIRFRPDILLVVLGFIAFGNMAVEGSMYNWIVVYFASVVAAPADRIRLGYIACMGLMTVGRFLADRLIMRFGRIRVLQVSGFSMLGGFMLLLLLPRLVPATLGAACIGFGMAAGVPICFSLAASSSRVPPSVALSTVAVISYCGFLLCPPLIGHISNAFDLRWGFAPIAALTMLLIVPTPFLRRLCDGRAAGAEDKHGAIRM